MLEACPEDSKEQCMSAAKDMLAAVTGRDASAISDDMLREHLNDEMASELGERTGSCMDQAENDAAKQTCRTALAAAALVVAVGEPSESRRAGGSERSGPQYRRWAAARRTWKWKG